MSDAIITFLVCLIACIAGVAIGVLTGKNDIAVDCATLGKFRIGQTVYECKEVKK